MNTEQERADFEKWAENTEHRSERNMFERAEFEAALGRGKTYDERDFQMYLLGRRVALQSQDREDAQRFRKIMNMTRAEREEVLFFACDRDVLNAIDHARRIEGDGE